jgi:hypothetical protein
MLEDNIIYLDKTEQIYKLVQKRSTLTIYPRRFGKSVFFTTI